MKVLDLQCPAGHVFEGWFGSEADFVEQHRKSLVQCPLCGDPSVTKKLSAPRLSLSGSTAEAPPSVAQTAHPVIPTHAQHALTEAWLAVARKLVAETTDVGSTFAEEARKIHYGETQPRGIRGTATPDEAHALADEGIEVLSFPLPNAVKEPLQ
jgi:hypothetical protein